MEEYYATKRELFYLTEGPRLANAEDPWGRRLREEIGDVKTFGGVADADYRVAEVEVERKGTTFELHYRGGVLRLETPLLGLYNVLNAAGAASLALVAAELADLSIVTTDDAYSEDPAKIAREVLSGVPNGHAEVVLDRREAIRRA